VPPRPPGSAAHGPTPFIRAWLLSAKLAPNSIPFWKAVNYRQQHRLFNQYITAVVSLPICSTIVQWLIGPMCLDCDREEDA